MALISTDEDVAAILAAEDAAIAEAANPREPQPIPVGEDLAAMIDRLTAPVEVQA